MGRVIKAVYFNSDTETTLLQYASSLPNFSTFVKDCLKKDMNPSDLIPKEIKAYIDEALKRQITIYDVTKGNEAKNDIEQFF